ncbi:MAG: hypothetical protein IM595_00575, partial [Phenylobacterium sp.]|nr:hypothetical protein [Phenylobacterium sp.]
MSVNRRHLLAATGLLLPTAACAAPAPGLAGLLPEGAYHPGGALVAYRRRDSQTFEAAQ